MSEQSRESFVDTIRSKHGSIEAGIRWFEDNITAEPIDYRLNLQVLYNLVGEEERAFQTSEQLVLIAAEDPRVQFNRGWHLIKRGQVQEGFSLLEYGRSLATFGNSNFQSPAQRLLDIDFLDSKHRLLLALEGGLGDEIINVRFINNLYEQTGIKPIVSCHPSLVTLFAGLENASAIITHDAVCSVYHDYFIPAMSAPALLCQNVEDFRGDSPYLSSEATLAWPSWVELIKKGNPGRPLKVGIRWSGSPAFEHQQFRIFPREILTDLVGIPDIQFYSFQKDQDTENLPEGLNDLEPFMLDWSHTASGLSQMDLVISSCTSVAHCAAALGVPTWVIVPKLSYYVWAAAEDKSDWYPDARVFRQSEFGNWDDMKDRIRKAVLAWKDQKLKAEK